MDDTKKSPRHLAAIKKLEQAKARVAAYEARESQAARKADTKRKIVLGGLLLDAAGKDEKFARVVTALLNRVVREQDQKAFQGWEPPSSMMEAAAETAIQPPVTSNIGGAEG
jgi:polyphosphate kinase 2 (PPK2 family)